MFANGLDVGAVFRHPVFLATFVIAIPAWIIAFAGQCAVEAQHSKYNKRVAEDLSDIAKRATVETVLSPDRSLWFAIWVQLGVTIFLFLSGAADSLAINRFQLSIFIAIALVFAVQGVSYYIYTKSFKEGLVTAVGWLLCAMVDIVWLLYLTSEDGSLLYHTFNSGGTGGMSGWGTGGPRRRSVHGNHDGGVYGSEASGLRQGAADRGMASHEMASSKGGYSMGGYGSGPLEPPHMPVTMPVSTSRDDFSAATQSVDSVAPTKRAKANYAYTASPDDPNEVSFAKGEILDIIDNTGKWFQVRTAAGQTGIAPSNYLTEL